MMPIDLSVEFSFPAQSGIGDRITDRAAAFNQRRSEVCPSSSPCLVRPTLAAHGPLVARCRRSLASHATFSRLRPLATIEVNSARAAALAPASAQSGHSASNCQR